MDNLAWGINLAVIGFFLGFVPLLAQAADLGPVAGDLRYPAPVGTLSGVANDGNRARGIALVERSRSFSCALAVEILIFVNMGIFLVILCRHADRSGEADRHEKWLRSLPARSPAHRGCFPHHVQRGPRVRRAGNRHGKGPRLSPLQSLGAGRRPARLAPRSVCGAGSGVYPPRRTTSTPRRETSTMP